MPLVSLSLPDTSLEISDASGKAVAVVDLLDAYDDICAIMYPKGSTGDTYAPEWVSGVQDWSEKKVGRRFTKAEAWCFATALPKVYSDWKKKFDSAFSLDVDSSSIPLTHESPNGT